MQGDGEEGSAQLGDSMMGRKGSDPLPLGGAYAAVGGGLAGYRPSGFRACLRAISDCFVSMWVCAKVNLEPCCCRKRVVVAGRTFTIRREVGAGGYSTVYLVQDVRSKNHYALKRMYCQTPEQSRRADAEVRVHMVGRLASFSPCPPGSLSDTHFLFRWVPLPRPLAPVLVPYRPAFCRFQCERICSFMCYL